MPEEAWGEGLGEGQAQMQTLERAAASHSGPLPANGERGTRGFVEIANVTHAYGGEAGVIALNKLSLSIGEGEFAAVVGPSGCGKSTLMKLVTGLQFPLSGAVSVGGSEVKGPLKIAGMAFQAPSLLPWRRTRENILLPLEIVQPHRRRLRRERAAYVAKVEALLAQVGLDGLGDKYPWELSGGMQQRASLCRALIHEPRLLMLDEPFAALDSFTREELWCVIRDLHAARPVTIILVTHDLREAAFLADRVFCLSSRPGRVIAERRVPFPRPRSLEVTFTAEFTDLVHDLRSQIATARQAE
jgi:NitT/TauT family transport system ATP-binding protein